MDDYELGDEEYEYEDGGAAPAESGAAGVVPVGRKREVKFRSRDGKIDSKERIYARYRACLVCRLIATEEQFLQHGCPNCHFLDLKSNRSGVYSCTTTKFSGMIAVMKPGLSWAARFNGIADGVVPGCYAVAAYGELPERNWDSAAAAARG